MSAAESGASALQSRSGMGWAPLAEAAGPALSFLRAIAESVLRNEVLLYAIGLCAFLALIDFARWGFRVLWPRRKVECVLATLAIAAANALFAPYVLLLADTFQATYDGLGIPRVDPAFWAGVPAWILVPLAIFVYDVANYWNHRIMHKRLFWPVHAIHHSEPDVGGLTTFRVHAFESLVMMGSYTLLLSWLGFPPGVLAGSAVLLGLFNVYQHIDVDWHHGPLRYVLASPRYHQWHHADVPAAYGKNLANVFPFLDLAFGTYYVPGPCTVALGAKGVPQNDVVRLLLYPLTEWGRMARRALGRGRKTAPAEELSQA